ncbi:hypothetical protein A2Z33_01060 [Candidatus Gottesmanbacteria bacterium RBG_16_52_11]|uniref:Uncharacterized protein n=1 Tax=Candidatus Gottesmanbacteria bacterium RBG_16_52_11 TaxID=1798374 RepID=A0A1F5YNX2_9BACT|nr:MAG: hypothetical protein A2Z33_01060 [Candidatus Gottesmanbacteria bacterium RBG_16_52_11]
MSKILNIVSAINSVNIPEGNRPIAPWLSDETVARVYVKSVNPEGLTALSVIATLIPDELAGYAGLAYLKSAEAESVMKLRMQGVVIDETGRSGILEHYGLQMPVPGRENELPGYAGELNVYPIRRETE